MRQQAGKGDGMKGPSFNERFIADSMLGRLARWLRIIGYDTTYYINIKDELLIEKSLLEGRWIITRDTHLIRRRLVMGYTFIKDNDPMDQLRQIVEELNLNIYKGLLTRCLECNTGLIHAYRGDVIGVVPDYIYSANSAFFLCTSCNRVYWKGSHIDRIKERLTKIFPGEAGKR